MSLSRCTTMVCATLCLLAWTSFLSGRQVSFPAQSGLAQAQRLTIPYSQAKGFLEVLRNDLLPTELQRLTPQERETAWSAWIEAQDGRIRSRLEQGDEDSVANLALFGMAFTAVPRVTEAEINTAFEGRTLPRGAERRISDLVTAAASPGTNERLAFVADVLTRQGFSLSTESGSAEARRWLAQVVRRVVTEYFTSLPQRGTVDEQTRLIQGVTQFRERGLSSDTWIGVNYALHDALSRLAAAGHLRPGTMRRVAIVGPGLDFTDKREGYDFYPQQTIQPFALIDSLSRLKLTPSEGFNLVTLDVSPRVNRHIEAARSRARAGAGYVIHLPRGGETYQWRPELVRFWEELGGGIGRSVRPVDPPRGFDGIKARAFIVDPSVVLSVVPRDLNVVLQRLDLATDSEKFDLVIATNILVYYNAFEHALALANIASMLRPGGLLLSNTLPLLVPGHPLTNIGFSDVVYTDPPSTDRVFWAQRQ